MVRAGVASVRAPSWPSTWSATCAGVEVCAAILLVLAAPVIAVAAILVKLTSRGPALYRQVRLGKGLS